MNKKGFPGECRQQVNIVIQYLFSINILTCAAESVASKSSFTSARSATATKSNAHSIGVAPTVVIRTRITSYCTLAQTTTLVVVVAVVVVVMVNA